MNTEKLSTTVHALSVKCGDLLIEAKAEFERGEMPDAKRFAQIRELNSKIAGLCFAAHLLLNEDEIHQFIYRTGLTQEQFETSIATITKDIQ